MKYSKKLTHKQINKLKTPPNSQKLKEKLRLIITE